MRKPITYIIGVLLLTCPVHTVQAQESVFDGLQSNLKKAERYFERGNYSDALKYFLAAKKQKKTPAQVDLRIARTYAFLKDHKNAVEWLKLYQNDHRNLPADMRYLMAESLTSLGNYQEAIEWYQQYGALNPDDKRVMPKIWRLRNVKYLYEDSVYYAVKELPFNSPATDYGATVLDGKLIFVSNRETYGGVKVVDGVYQRPFFKRYYVNMDRQPSNVEMDYGSPKTFTSELDVKFHQGPITFGKNGSLAVFTGSAQQKDATGNYRLHLYYATRQGTKWSDVKPVDFNHASFTFSNPALTEDGSVLYFSADLNGGFGGMDLYRSRRTITGWSKPENLGEPINTAGNEDYPFVHPTGVLYFSSDGHGGLGGLDVFKVHLDMHSEVKNLGYPVNTQHDDFGIYLNAKGTHGYISSNRLGGLLNDDLFELQVDVQEYPLAIKGFLKYRNAQWEDELKIEELPVAKMQLVDVYNGKTVYETVSGAHGEFHLEVPYSSQFKILVIHDQLGDHTVSLEIPKNRKKHSDHEIVIVKEQFQTTPQNNQDVYQVKNKAHEGM